MAINPNFVGLITDFIGLQSVPANIGNVVKSKVESGEIDAAALGLAAAGTAQTAASITQGTLFPTAATAVKVIAKSL